MKQKQKIKEVVVVEGKTDSDRLKQIFEVDTFETYGTSITKSKIEFIKRLNSTRGVILFLDPDHTGNKIRNKILEFVPNTKNCFLDRKNAFDKKQKKQGLAEASEEAIKAAFHNVATFNEDNQSIAWEQYLDLDLNSKLKRTHITEKLKISECNHKQLFKKLNMLNISFESCLKMLEDFKD